MSGRPDHGRAPTKPFLISKDESGYRLAVRTTRYNSQNYPIVTVTMVDESFKSSNAARAYARENLGAETGEFQLKRAT